jgi:hypothetical protein
MVHVAKQNEVIRSQAWLAQHKGHKGSRVLLLHSAHKESRALLLHSAQDTVKPTPG